MVLNFFKLSVECSVEVGRDIAKQIFMYLEQLLFWSNDDSSDSTERITTLILAQLFRKELFDKY